MVRFRSTGAEDHDWVVVDLPVQDAHATSASHAHGTGSEQSTVHVEAQPGETREVTFVPEQPGRDTVLCTLPEHQEQGMIGILSRTGEPVALRLVGVVARTRTPLGRASSPDGNTMWPEHPACHGCRCAGEWRSEQQVHVEAQVGHEDDAEDNHGQPKRMAHGERLTQDAHAGE